MKKRVKQTVPTLFVALIVGGLLLFIVTSKDVFLRVGVTAAAVVIFCWCAFLGTRSILQKLRSKRYFDMFLTTAMDGGISLLLIYFIWLLLWEMFRLSVLGPVPPAKTSKLVFCGAVLIFVSVVTLFISAAIGRIKNSRRH